MNEVNGNNLFSPFLSELTADQLLFWWVVCISCIAFVWWKQKRELSSYLSVIISSGLLASVISSLTQFIFSRNGGGEPLSIMFGWPKAYIIFKEDWSYKPDMIFVTFVSWFLLSLALMLLPQVFFKQPERSQNKE